MKLPDRAGSGDRQGGIGKAPWSPGKADFVNVSETEHQWSVSPDEALVRGRLTSCLVHAVAMGQSAEWFNSDVNFERSLNVAVQLKGQVLGSTPQRLELRGSELLLKLPAELGSSRTLTSLRITLPAPTLLPVLDDALLDDALLMSFTYSAPPGMYAATSVADCRMSSACCVE